MVRFSVDERPDTLIECCAKVVSNRLIDKYGISVDDALNIGLECAEAVRAAFGGGSVYIPRIDRGRDREIFRKFNGRNMRELGIEYGLTQERIRQIVAAQRVKKVW